MSATAAPPEVDVVARARDILAGRLVPPPLELSAERKAVLDRLIHEHVTPTPEAYQFHYEDWAFNEHYDGTIVMYTRLPDGKIAVLGSGADDFHRLFDELSRDELNRVETINTPPQEGLWVLDRMAIYGVGGEWLSD